MKKIYHTWQDVERQVQEILRQIQLSAWRPDYVVGLTRGGLVKQDWMNSCHPTNPMWAQIWCENVKVAVLYDNEASKSELDISYSAVTINKAEEDSWIVFPWEDWWK